MNQHGHLDGELITEVGNQIRIAYAKGATSILELVLEDIRDHPGDDLTAFLTSLRDELILANPEAIAP